MTDSQSPGAAAPSNGKPDTTGFLPGDDTWTQFRNIYSILTGKMSNEGIEQFRVARDTRNEEADCKRCEDQRDYLLQYSPTIRFLSENIQQLGGDLYNHNIYCRRCTDRKGGGFDPEYGILICANEMKDQGHLEDTMAHEMVHAFDHLRFKVNWSDNLRHAACTEACVILIVLTCQRLLNPSRFELVRSAASADGRASSSGEGSGSLHNSIKSAFDGEPSSLCEHVQPVKTKPMPPGSSMKSGIVVSGTHAHLMRSTDDTTTHTALHYPPPFGMIDFV
ncbi:hypothetical protein PDIDSM_3736 [Penicillium digitatum]|nr:hypothetical protein PDIDSM_3736 [Penicillium digitatum]